MSRLRAQGSVGDAPVVPEEPVVAPAASDATPTGVNPHTGQPWVDWEELRSGRYVTVDGGCTEVVNNDGTPARSRTTDASAQLDQRTSQWRTRKASRLIFLPTCWLAAKYSL